MGSGSLCKTAVGLRVIALMLFMCVFTQRYVWGTLCKDAHMRAVAATGPPGISYEYNTAFLAILRVTLPRDVCCLSHMTPRSKFGYVQATV